MTVSGGQQISRCREDTEGVCTLCPRGWFKETSGVWNTPCLECPPGSQENANRDGCVYCDYASNAGKRHYKPTSDPEDHKTCEDFECPDGSFPDEIRTDCRQITSVTIEAPSDIGRGSGRPEGMGFENYDTVTTTWTFKESALVDGGQAVSVQLCALRFTVVALHARCPGPFDGSTVVAETADWSSCAKVADSKSKLFFNFNPASRACEVLVSTDAADCRSDGDLTTSRGWFALMLESGWEQGCVRDDRDSTTGFTLAWKEVDDNGNADNSASLHLTHDQDDRTYANQCIKDDTYLKARVALSTLDNGPVRLTAVTPSPPLTPDAPSTSSGIDLDPIVYKYSAAAKVRGNVAATLDRSAVSVLPRVIYPTSPWVSCHLPRFLTDQESFPSSSVAADQAHVLDPHHGVYGVQTITAESYEVQKGQGSNLGQFHNYAAQLRENGDVIQALVNILKSSSGRIEPVDASDDAFFQFGDLKLLAHDAFPSNLRHPVTQQDETALFEFISQCLLDTDAITNDEIFQLSNAANTWRGSLWSTFGLSSQGDAADDENGGTSPGKLAFGRLGASPGLFVGFTDRFRCRVALYDGCEHSLVVGSSHVVVTPLGLQANSLHEGGRFGAGGGIPVTILGAGFVVSQEGPLRQNPQCPTAPASQGGTTICPVPDRAIVTDYDCTWRQDGENYEQTTVANADEFGKVSCTFPQWFGKTGQVRLQLTGPVLEYQGCYKLDQDQLPSRGFSRGIDENNVCKYSSELGLDSAQCKYSGLASCQYESSRTDGNAQIFALKTHLEREDEFTGCWYSSSESVTTTLSGLSKVSDDLCDAPCQNNPEGYNPNAAAMAGANSNQYDSLTHQRCGSKDGKYASVFAAVLHERLDAGAYSIYPTTPEPPTWDFEIFGGQSAFQAGPGGQIKIYWAAPLVSGGQPIIAYEVKFKKKTALTNGLPGTGWESHRVTKSRLGYEVASSHRDLCSEPSIAGAPRPLRLSKGEDNVGGLTYRMCQRG